MSPRERPGHNPGTKSIITFRLSLCYTLPTAVGSCPGAVVPGHAAPFPGRRFCRAQAERSVFPGEFEFPDWVEPG